MAVVQYVVMSLFYLDHKYDFDWMNKTIGIIGLGSIGGLLYDVLKKLGIRTMQNDPPRAMQEGSADFVDLQTIRDKADIISLHVPLIQEGNFSTRHLLNDDFFASGSKKITIINTSRGKVLSAETLKKWKARGVIDKLVLDVWENEPNVDPELLKMTNISTPHIAGYSLQGKKNASYQSLHHIEDFFKLSLPNIKKIIQPPPSQNIKYTCQNEAEKDAIWNILKQIWNIEQDSNSLSANPYLFKQLRKKYIFRPQISEFGIEFADCSPKIISTINTVSSANTGI
jgi:erythronate-4-phosphate dehydrogenase